MDEYLIETIFKFNPVDRIENIKKEIISAVGPLYGNYAVRSLIEDYEYYTSQSGGIPDTDGFLLKLKLSTDPDGTIYLSSPDVELTWNDTKKKWDGFANLAMNKKKKSTDLASPTTYHPEFDRTNFETNKKMLERFHSLSSLKSLFSSTGFLYDGEKIDFPTYLGIFNVYLDELNGTQTVSIQDSEGTYTWDPGSGEWIVGD